MADQPERLEFPKIPVPQANRVRSASAFARILEEASRAGISTGPGTIISGFSLTGQPSTTGESSQTVNRPRTRTVSCRSPADSEVWSSRFFRLQDELKLPESVLSALDPESENDESPERPTFKDPTRKEYYLPPFDVEAARKFDFLDFAGAIPYVRGPSYLSCSPTNTPVLSAIHLQAELAERALSAGPTRKLHRSSAPPSVTVDLGKGKTRAQSPTEEDKGKGKELLPTNSLVGLRSLAFDSPRRRLTALDLAGDFCSRLDHAQFEAQFGTQPRNIPGSTHHSPGVREESSSDDADEVGNNESYADIFYLSDSSDESSSSAGFDGEGEFEELGEFEEIEAFEGTASGSDRDSVSSFYTF